MAGTYWQKNSIIAELKNHPSDFSFYQATWIMEQIAQQIAGSQPVVLLGDFNKPKDEFVRFKSSSAFGFPATDIATLEQQQLTINFMGLTGHMGMLPDHYTETLLDRLHLNDTALRDFLNLFNHRLIALFYRAWDRSKITISHQRAQHTTADDPFSNIFCALIGRHRLTTSNPSFPLTASTYYAGLLAQKTRSASGLTAIITDYFNIECDIETFQGQWLTLHPKDCTRIGNSDHQAQFSQLGNNAIAGKCSWNIQSNFKIVLGPLSYATFLRLLPNGNLLHPLYALMHYYIDSHLNFTIQLILLKKEIPPLRLGHTHLPQLGWNTWLY